MGRHRFFSVGGAAILAVALYAGIARSGPSPATVDVVSPSTVELKSSPIRKEWLLEGNPATFAKEVARSPDGSMTVFVWQTSAARFNWLYDSDEIITILDGEVFIRDAPGAPERRLGPGDVAFFPEGAVTTWRVPDHVRKVATLKRALPRPLAGVVHFMQVAKSWLKPTPAFAAD